MQNLVKGLRKRQGNQSQQDFADLLGIDQSTLSRLYSGDRRPGRKVVRGILKQFPELIPDEVALFLLENM